MGGRRRQPARPAVGQLLHLGQRRPLRHAVLEDQRRAVDLAGAQPGEHILLREEQAHVAEFALVPDLDMAGARGSALAALAAARLSETS